MKEIKIKIDVMVEVSSSTPKKIIDELKEILENRIYDLLAENYLVHTIIPPEVKIELLPDLGLYHDKTDQN